MTRVEIDSSLDSYASGRPRTRKALRHRTDNFGVIVTDNFAEGHTPLSLYRVTTEAIAATGQDSLESLQRYLADAVASSEGARS